MSQSQVSFSRRRLTSERLRIFPEGFVGSSENIMKLYIFGGPLLFDYAKQKPTVLVGAICSPLDLLFLSIPYLPPPTTTRPTHFFETVRNFQKHFLTGGPSNSREQLFTTWRYRGTFGIGVSFQCRPQTSKCQLCLQQVRGVFTIHWTLAVDTEKR